jgi:hypothetical protein
MRTSTAKANGFQCPKCGDETTHDETGLGYLRHTRNPTCDFQKGERDEFVPPEAAESWHSTENRDNGSLRTGEVRLKVGDVIEIQGEVKQRRVTYVMGSPGNWHVTFKGQGAVPEGQVEWRVVTRSGTQAVVSPALRLQVQPAILTSQPSKPEGRLHTVKLVLEIVAILLTIIGGVVALVWRAK